MQLVQTEEKAKEAQVTNAQFHSIMMMLSMIMSFQVKDNKLWTWFWICCAVYEMLMGFLWTWVLR